MRQWVILSLLLIWAQGGWAFQSIQDSIRLVKPEHSLCLQSGTTGLTIFYNHTIGSSHRLVMRGGVNYLAYRKRIRINTAPDSYLQIDPDFIVNIAQAGLKWYPLKRPSFFVAAGLGFTWHPYVDFVLTTNTNLNLGGLELTPQDVGIVRLGFRWHPVVGYLGWGFGPVSPRKRIGVGFEMGVYYLSRPRIKLDYEGFLETTNIDDQVPVVERNLSNYRYLPAITISFSYTLKRSR
ncbi:hypothetical protein WBJ53_07555 [Spirosoma sp. SC4-14]|uniref:hypothetical protein n=1 Tax=Spirosoma sp. SC4-14 TaxID=3128900 RepID=UPI0030D24FA4